MQLITNPDIWFAALMPVHIEIDYICCFEAKSDQSPMTCNIALESHHAKGQVCLKFSLQCISGGDLDFLSLVPPRAQRETASFQSFYI